MVRRVVRLRGAGYSHAESRGLEEDDFHPVLRRERRILRPRPAICPAGTRSPGVRQGVSGNRPLRGARPRDAAAFGSDWIGLPRAAGNRLAMEPRGLCVLASLRSYLDPAVARECADAQDGQTDPGNEYQRLAEN